ncbi:RICIN domain-containing protein [Kribbella sp. NBC_00382]|uniref:RICIN domain-containing protein n=1 Tax=Kribbella sp. NBC_00382 TaxID=2975967 RepID=UPI002E1E793D
MQTRKRIAGLFAVGGAACLLTAGLAAPATASQSFAGEWIVNANSSKCVADPAASTTSGVQAIQFDCEPDGPSRRWAVTVYPKDHGRVVYSFRSTAAPDLCLTGTGASGGAVKLLPCVSGAAGANQRWAYDSYHRLINTASWKCLAVPAAQLGNGVKLIQFDCREPNSETGLGFEQVWTGWI